MSNDRARISRRKFLQSSALGAAAAASGTLAAPRVLRAQGAPVKLGVLHPVSGALSYSGQQGRLGATIAIDEINAAGGIKALGGAKIDPVLGDAQSTPEGGNAEVEKMNAAGVAAIVGGYASSICLAASQTAARYDLPYLVDVGVADNIMTRGLKNTFRFGPGFGVIAKTAIDNLITINDQAGKPAKTVMIVNEDSLFGSGLAKLLNAQLPDRGFQILETIPHPTPTRDFNNVVLKIKAQNPDLIIPANYYNEYVLLARTLQQQRVRPKGIYSILGGAASSYKFVKEFPEAAQYIMDCNHWFDPRNPKALALKKKVEDQGQFYTYEVYMNYSCVLLLADALERAASADRAKIIAALETSTFAGHVMPYGPTKFVNGQNQGAAPVNTQVLGNDIQVIFPATFASAKPVFPMPADRPREVALRLCAGSIGIMLSLDILIPAVLNGIMKGAVYALVALGADADLRRAAHHQLRSRRAADRGDVRGLLRVQHARPRSHMSAAVVLTPLFFVLGYALQRFVIGPASHGEERNILLVTLGLAVVIENGLLYAFRADTRTVDLRLCFQCCRSRLCLHPCAAPRWLRGRADRLR